MEISRDLDPGARPVSTGAGESTPSACRNCGNGPGGRYCGACGRDRRMGRLTIRGVLATAIGKVLDPEQPLLRTIVELTIRPGATIAAYVNGRRERYSNPFTYCLLWAAITTITVQSFGVDILPENVMVSVRDLPGEGPRVDQRRINEVVIEWLGLIDVVWLPVLAGLHRLFFWEWRLNVAEWYATVLYAHGHLMLLSWLPLVLGVRETLLGIVLLTCLPMVWNPYVVCGLLRTRSPSVFLRSAGATAIYFVSFTIPGTVYGIVAVLADRLG